jgi:hypothetical protein
MIKAEYNSKLREFTANNLSPTEVERRLISKVYNAFQELFSQNCIQIGSYPRFTSIRPIHDLDIIFGAGDWDNNNHNPYELLKTLQIKINSKYKNPTNYQIECYLQTHSVTILFKNHGEEIFSVDIVPGYRLSKNEFGQDTYKVPEIEYLHQGVLRNDYYRNLIRKNKEMLWIASDPRGYIKIAQDVNNLNNDFRKTVKFIKKWKRCCESKEQTFKLKSFHIEQILVEFFQKNPKAEIFDGIFNFFYELPENIKSPRIIDRADPSRYIDEYLTELTIDQKERIIEARDCFLINLEKLTSGNSIDSLVDSCFYRRASESEQFLFDYKIPTLLDDSYTFEISGRVTQSNGYTPKNLPMSGAVELNRKIKFEINGSQPSVDYFYWKVKNDNNCGQPRGEITKGNTRNVPEHVKYFGIHYVECYAILHNTCVAKDRQLVKVYDPWRPFS